MIADFEPRLKTDAFRGTRNWELNDMELHPPVSPSDDDIYQLGNLEGQATALPSKRARGGNVDTDVASAPAATGQAVPTVVSTPVVIGLVSSDEPATASSTIATAMGSGPASAGVEKTVESRTAAANGSPTSPPGAATTVTNAGASAAPAPAMVPGPRVAKLRPRRRRGRVRLRHVLQAWSVSLIVHVAVLSALAAATFSSQDAIKKMVNFDSALAGYRNGEPEPLPIYADPDNIPRDKTIGDENASTAGEPVPMVMGYGGGD